MEDDDDDEDDQYCSVDLSESDSDTESCSYHDQYEYEAPPFNEHKKSTTDPPNVVVGGGKWHTLSLVEGTEYACDEMVAVIAEDGDDDGGGGYENDDDGDGAVEHVLVGQQADVYAVPVARATQL